MAQIHAYLSFDGNCGEAMNFYKESIGGELFLQIVKDSPMAKDWPEAAQQKVLHACLVNAPLMLMGSDMGEEPLVKGNTISLSLTCNELDELKSCFSKLSEGGTIVRPLHEFFAGTMGVITDKYGMDWMFYSENKSKREVPEKTLEEHLA